jgi:hypothetical protein
MHAVKPSEKPGAKFRIQVNEYGAIIACFNPDEF